MCSLTQLVEKEVLGYITGKILRNFQKNYSLCLIFSSPGVLSSSNRNRYKETSCKVICGWHLELTILLSKSCQMSK
jgi:hypothetical protein